GPAGGLAKPERPVRRPVNVDEVEVRLFLQDRVGGPERAGDVEPPADVVVDSVADVAQREVPRLLGLHRYEKVEVGPRGRTAARQVATLEHRGADRMAGEGESNDAAWRDGGLLYKEARPWKPTHLRRRCRRPHDPEVG